MEDQTFYWIDEENYIHPINPQEGAGVILWLVIAFISIIVFFSGYFARGCGL